MTDDAPKSTECRILAVPVGDVDGGAGEEYRLGTFELREYLSLSEN
jgi:hypothetical protein